jgi:glycosyltransferase involved in cell wall biosynthesis
VVGDGKVGGLEGHRVLRLPESADSTQAILALEELQAEGGEFLLVPSGSLGWLRRHAWFHRHLERRYPSFGKSSELLVFDVTTYHSFSVVICTYRRASLVEKAIRSVLSQNYPADRFEVIVVDNDSRDGTEDVVRRLASTSPVPLSYHVEERNGLSFCRNLGVGVARSEFVAYLDDDATACADWLRCFNAVINEHHALVVGGRVEKVFEEGFVTPDWFGYQYMRSFFGLNYREWGKTDRVFRITHPRYIGGGNSAYARRLFDRFGSFHTALGRNKKTLLAAEESYLNLRLDRAGVPIYYTDDAVIHHFIDSRRLTRRHVVRKAAWSGISNALMYSMLFGHREARRRTRAGAAEIRRLGVRIIRSPRDPENFSRLCRIVYHLGFFAKLVHLDVQRIFGRDPLADQREGSWGPADHLAEVEAWPESSVKYQQLHELLRAQGDEERAREALDRLAERLLRLDVPVTAASGLDGLWGPLRQLGYRRLLERIGDTVDAQLPEDATLIVVSRGDDELLAACRRAALHFPQLDSGIYAGHYPATDEDAVRHLEQLRARGGDYLVLPSTGFWWLEHYSGLREHLEGRYPVVVKDDDTCLIFSLDGAAEPTAASVPPAAWSEAGS